MRLFSTGLRRNDPLGRCAFSLLLVAASVGACGQQEPTKNATWTLEPVVVWASEEAAAEGLPDDVPARRALPSTPQAIAWGSAGDLWATFDEAIGRIADAASSDGIEMLDPPQDEDGDPLEPSQVLAPDGPEGRVAVGLWNGLVAVLGPGDQPNWSILPVREGPYGAGMMPLVRWTSSGALAIHVHLTCDVAILDPETGVDVWRRTDGAARYPATSANGKYLLLPWEAGVAAEVLDAETGKSLASLPPLGESRCYGAIDDSGRWAVMGRQVARLTTWDVTSASTSEVTMGGEGARPVGLAFLPGTTTCVVAGPQSVRLLDVPTRRWLTQWSLPGDSRVLTFLPQGDLAVSPDGQFIAVRTDGPTICVLKVERSVE